MTIGFTVTHCPILRGDLDPLYERGQRFPAMAVASTAYLGHWPAGIEFERDGHRYQVHPGRPQTLVDVEGGPTLIPTDTSFTKGQN
jgi:hypothetical protein